MRKKKAFSDEDILSVLREKMFGADDGEETSASTVEDDRFICVLRSVSLDASTPRPIL
jgi:hypothetical protein